VHFVASWHRPLPGRRNNTASNRSFVKHCRKIQRGQSITSLSQFRFVLIALLAALVVGCASWKEPVALETAFERELPKTYEHRKRVILEVEFVTLAVHEDDIDQSASLWQWVDETAIDATVRGRLIDNGVRVGLVANDERFRSRLADTATEQDVVEKFLSEASVASDVSHGEFQIPMRLGRRYELPLCQPIEGSHVALVRVNGETIGKTLNHAQYSFAITATQANTQNEVRLRFRPEIQFGDTRQKWVSSDTAIRIDSRRDTWSIPELDLTMTASEGDTLVIAAATPVTGMAKQMLTGTGSNQDTEQLVVLVHVAQVPTAVDQF
jgi:hypothetical protein